MTNNLIFWPIGGRCCFEQGILCTCKQFLLMMMCRFSFSAFCAAFDWLPIANRRFALQVDRASVLTARAVCLT